VHSTKKAKTEREEEEGGRREVRDEYYIDPSVM
jgi:hypothetical protein